MGRLKDLRLEAGMNQSQISELIKINISQISYYENDLSLPSLEDMVILDKKFGQKVDYKEDFTPLRRHQIVQALIELCERYPLPAVMEFSARVFRREKCPDNIIIHYANVSTANEEPPLLQPGIVKRCNDCDN